MHSKKEIKKLFATFIAKHDEEMIRNLGMHKFVIYKNPVCNN
jgi:hypothetical protein